MGKLNQEKEYIKKNYDFKNSVDDGDEDDEFQPRKPKNTNSKTPILDN